MSPLNPRYAMPALAGLCAVTALALAGTFHVPTLPATAGQERSAQIITPVTVERREIPDAGTVLSKHLFVQARKAENMKSNSELLIRGVYLGEQESSIVLSLRSKPGISLRVWQKGKDRLIAKITDPKDARYPIIAFLKEWDLQEVSYSKITFHNPLTDETETYEVDYTPAKKVDDNAIAGYGQGGVLDIDSNESRSSSSRQSGTQSQQNTRSSISSDIAKTINSRVSGMMERMSSQQRKEFAEAVNQAAQEGNTKGDRNDRNSSGNSSRNRRN